MIKTEKFKTPNARAKDNIAHVDKQNTREIRYFDWLKSLTNSAQRCQKIREVTEKYIFTEFCTAHFENE